MNLLQPQTSAVRFFKTNDHGRDFVAGDIHGQFDILKDLLDRIDFQKNTDRLFLTGDLIDRGPLSHRVLEWLAKPWLHSVKGNHEQMVIDSIRGTGNQLRHTKNGGKWFYDRPPEDRQKIAERLALLPVAIEIQLQDSTRVGVIHAEPPGWELGLNWSDSIALLSSTTLHVQKNALLQALYSRSRINTKSDSIILGARAIYVGHSTVPEPLSLGNTTYIDTGCSFPDGKLTLLDIKSGKVFQSLKPRQLSRQRNLQ